MKFLVTGGAGFIGSALVRFLIKNTKHEVLNLDKLTYAGNLASLREVDSSERYTFKKVDICNFSDLQKAVESFSPDVVMHLAAESHVDRSIEKSGDFMQTNIIGTYNLLEIARSYYHRLPPTKKAFFRFHHISTDEVFGDLENENMYFTENTAYAPSSPYSASKAASDHLVRAWHRTYKLPVLITNCSNNFGPYHFPEKLIPLTIINALNGKQLPVYGSGQQIRDWLYVDDHVKALYAVVLKGTTGETYNIGGNNEKSNIEVVNLICDLLEDLIPSSPYSKTNANQLGFKSLIAFVDDRPGHDQRYAIDSSKIINDIGWKPEESFESGMQKTVQWFLNNQLWWSKAAMDGR